MAFGQQRVHGRRGRPPKDPALRAQRASLDDDVAYSPPAAHALAGGKRRLELDEGALPVPPAASSDTHASVEEFESLLHDMRARYEQSVDERVQQAVRERDAIQAQFDRLKDLRVTQSEKTLVEWKKASETRHRHALESLAAWKNRAEHAEHRVRELERSGAPPSAAASAAAPGAAEQVAALTDQLARVERELRDERAKAARLDEARASEQAARDDDAAIRRMYEDLTGMIVRGVTTHEHAQRRYDLLLTGADFHDLQFSLEESQLHTDTGAHAHVRDDFVYIPHIDDTRDARLLASEHMPDHFLEQIRFERGAATKFLTALHRSIKK